MSGLDFFAWIVLIVLICSTAAVVIFMAMLPGMIAKRRGHPWAQAVTCYGRPQSRTMCCPSGIVQPRASQLQREGIQE
jgi:Protein of unknown function (DUF3302)